MERKGRFGIIEDMWYRIKMWWLLRHFGKQITTHTLEQTREYISSGGVILSTQTFFIDGTDAWPGLARKALKRFSPILWWRRKDNQKKIKKKIAEHNDIFDSCVKEKYISLQMARSSNGVTALTPVKGELYDESRGFAGLIQVVGKKFPMVWVFIGWIITVIIGVLAYISK